MTKTPVAYKETLQGVLEVHERATKNDTSLIWRREHLKR